VSYGVGSSQCDTDENTWLQNSLLGFSQVGNMLTIYSYSRNGSDYNTAQDEITYELMPQ
jgi:hypothetical protein